MSHPYPSARRGISPVNKLICLSLLSVVLMVLDERYTAMQRAKEYIAGALYPLQWMAQQPVEWYEYGSALFQSQDYLLTENERLTLENSRLKIDLHRADMNARELEQLKSLAALGSHGLGEAQTAEVVSNGKEPVANRIIEKQKRDARREQRHHIRQDKRPAAVFIRYIGKAPDIAQTHRRADGGKHKRPPAGEGFALGILRIRHVRIPLKM